MKFAHLADTHIRNLKYHKEYKEVFDEIYKDLKKEKVDFIIHCGDICHTKTQISPEYVEMASNFLSSLADIAPTYVILGNHDGNLRNGNRQDSITPIAEALDHKNLHLLKNSGETVIDDGYALNVLSVFDADNWTAPTDDSIVNIALYHGSISGCTTDIGWKMEHGEHDISIFDDFDFAMLGDIHLENQILDKEGRVRYAGSTIQQNFGESLEKGFLLWDIKGKDDFTCKPILYTNPKPFISIKLDEKGKLTGGKYPKGARLRLVVEHSITSTALKKAIDVAKKKYNPESVSVINRSTSVSSVNVSEDFKRDDLRDVAVQEKLIREYLSDYEISDELDSKILELNKKYNEIAEKNDETYRNTNYEVLELKWDNLFNYGKGNRLDFTKYNGITGVFGKNFSGKSSIIDSLLFTMYNSISKNSRKNLNIVNNDKSEGYGQVKIRRGNKIYTITRSVEKYLKKLKGNETVEAKTILDFCCEDVDTGEVKSLNGTTRADTDKNIIKYFGTIDDFLLTSMASQLGSLVFINEGSTKRKEILAKFLDLDLLEKKFKTAKEDASDLKVGLKKLESIEYDTELESLQKELDKNEEETESRKNTCNTIKKDISEIEAHLAGLLAKINSVPTEIIDIKKVNSDIAKCEKDISSIEKQIEQKKEEDKINQEKIKKANEFIKSFNINVLLEQKDQHNELSNELTSIVAELEKDQYNLESLKKQVSLLGEVPCGQEYSHCKFIKGAYEAKDKLDLVQLSMSNKNKVRDALRERVDGFQIEKVIADTKKFDQFIEIKTNLENNSKSDSLVIENLKSKKSIAEHELKDLQAKKKEYEKNKDAIEKVEELKAERIQNLTELAKHKNVLKQCDNQLLKLYKNHGYYEQKIENLNEKRAEKENMQNEFEAYDLYMRSMHPNGIAYDIIKRSLPIINCEISKVLSNVVDFEVFFETEDNRLDIYLKHPDRDPSPLEMASGAEKTVSAMAIRLAFIAVSTIPRSQLFVLDEPGTALDEERMEGFTRILDVVKSVFKTVFLISHLDSLKDTADSVINIETKDGYANVNC